MDSELILSIRRGECIPFVGAGVSKNLNLPTFDELLAAAGRELGYEPDIFRLYGSNLELAEYYSLIERIDELVQRLDREWHDSLIDLTRSSVHRLLPELRAPIVYTTNWDRWLERSYERLGLKVHSVVKIPDFADVPGDVDAVVVKLHGDLRAPETIVLTERSYFDRLDFDSALDIRFQSDVLGRSVLFLGYSLADLNLRVMMYKLQKLWAHFEQDARPKSYLVMGAPNPVQEEILRSRGIIPVVLDGVSISDALRDWLVDLIDHAFDVRLDPAWP